MEIDVLCPVLPGFLFGAFCLFKMLFFFYNNNWNAIPVFQTTNIQGVMRYE